ncbi:MAG: RAD55 family ATPase [Haloarculaceae archaeon]
MGSARRPPSPIVDPGALARTGLAGGALDPLTVEVPAGTCLLVTGPPLSGTARLSTAALVAGHAAGSATVAVTTEEPGGDVRDRFERFAGPAYDADRFAVVDCAGGPAGDLREDGPDQRVSSPNDLTGVGMALMRALNDLDGGDGGYRLLFDSLSTLLPYRGAETTFKFAHTVCSRLRQAGALGLFTFDGGAHDDRAVNTLRQTFDGAVELDSGEDGPRVRVRGLGHDGEWASVDVPD